jgi:glycosyltransferase involved in cell wall biosynthesis
VEIEKILEAKPNTDLKNKYPNDRIIIFIGRLFEGKGVVDLIKAVSEIKTNNVKCFIVGDGPQKSNLERLAKELKIENKVIFFGYKKQEEVIGILKISDIFVNPSYNEGLPSSVIEAALCQKAIIATKVGGTPEIFTDRKSGFLIKTKDINLLKEKLELLIGNKNLRENLGESAFEEVKNRFDWNKNIIKYLNIFE